jgi:hypothetical protein
MRLILALVLLTSITGCRRSGCIDVGETMEVMARPSYAETRVVDHIRPGRHTYSDLTDDHLYGWYEVRGEKGVLGYLMVDPMAIRADCAQPYRDPRDRPPRPVTSTPGTGAAAPKGTP